MGDTAAARERWSAHVESWRKSGLSVAAYARQAGLKEVTLGTWKRRLALEEAQPVEFVEVKQAELAVARPHCIKVEVGRYRVEVSGDFEEDVLGRVFSFLEGRA